MSSYTGSYQVQGDRPMTIHITPERQVLLLPRSMPLVLSPDEARELAADIMAAAEGAGH
jgi:hypothetical protein